MLSKKSSVSCRNAWRRLSPKLGKKPQVACDRVELAKLKPLAHEIRDEAARAFVGEHAADLLLKKLRLAKVAAHRRIEQRVVGQTAPEKKREARGELKIADAIGGAGR